MARIQMEVLCPRFVSIIPPLRENCIYLVMPYLEPVLRDGVHKLPAVTAKIADLAIKKRLPLMFETGSNVDAGGLMSYAASDVDLFQRAAIYVDKILKGAKPAALPVEQPTKFELAINLKTAKQIGLIIPPNVLARADRVIK